MAKNGRTRLDPACLPAAPDFSFEMPLWQAGVYHVAGIDEAGRGAWAGPVAAGAIIFPANPELACLLTGVRDSKQMTPIQRSTWAEKLHKIAVAWGVGFATQEEIDALGILPATHLAAVRAVQALATPPAHLLLDYLLLPDCNLPQTALIKGDCRSMSIAAASILAKTARDALMTTLETQYPGYGFARHKGYGTAAHREAIARLGACPIHRLSFAPLRGFLFCKATQFMQS